MRRTRKPETKGASNSVAGMNVNTPSPALAVELPTFCPYQEAFKMQQAIASEKMRVAFFLGAGCPVSIRIVEGARDRPLIPAVKELTSVVRQSLEKSDEFRTSLGAINERLVSSGIGEPNIEQILSHVRSLIDVVGVGEIDGLSKSNLEELDREICEVTTQMVNVDLPSSETPYHQLAKWIRDIQRKNPVEIYTPNYDLLLEQALASQRVPHFDGFVGSRFPFFDLTAVVDDTLPVRWARIWKVHGSIDWWRTGSGDIVRREAGDPGDRQMIYPSHLKYEESRRMPYYALLDQLAKFLARGQAVLITCGYSFSDEHLNAVIRESLSRNPLSVCFALVYSDRAKATEAVVTAKRHSNLRMLAADGAVIGTIERDWSKLEKTEHKLHGIAAKAGELPGRSESPTGHTKFLLGDFKLFGDFLAMQLSSSSDQLGVENAQ